MPSAQQFICQKCKVLSNVPSFEKTEEGIPYCRCPHCNARNRIVQIGATPSEPGLVQVVGLLD